MKTIKFSLRAMAVIAAFTLSSCDKEPVEPDYTLKVVDFEAAELSADGYLNNSSYEEKGLTFVNNYTVDGGYWDGFSFSSMTDKTTPGLTNQYSVYATGGAADSEKFAVSSIFGTSEMEFAEGVSHEIEYAWFNNTTYAYIAIKDGNDGYGVVKGPFENGDWFLLTLTGYDTEDAQTGKKEIWLADFRGGKSFIMSDWTKVNLTSLGKVNRVTFALTSSDTGDWMNTPAYFCIDNVAYREVK